MKGRSERKGWSKREAMGRADLCGVDVAGFLTFIMMTFLSGLDGIVV